MSSHSVQLAAPRTTSYAQNFSKATNYAPPANMIAPNEDFISTEVLYLAKDPKHHEEKPYAIAYDAGGVIPQTNMTNESFPIQIQNFRPVQISNSFDDFGFAVEKLDHKWTAAQFRDEISVKERLYPQVERILRKQFPTAIAVRIIEHNVSLSIVIPR